MDAVDLLYSTQERKKRCGRLRSGLVGMDLGDDAVIFV